MSKKIPNELIYKENIFSFAFVNYRYYFSMQSYNNAV